MYKVYEWGTGMEEINSATQSMNIYCKVAFLSKRNYFWTITLPVFSRFILEHLVTVLNLLTGQRVHSHIWVFLCYFQEKVEDLSFPILSHFVIGTPKNICGICSLVKVVLLVLHQQRSTSMRHNAQAGETPDIFLVPSRGCVIHPDHTLDLVYLLSKACAEHLARTRNQSTLVAVYGQELLWKHRSGRLLYMLSEQWSCDQC